MIKTFKYIAQLEGLSLLILLVGSLIKLTSGNTFLVYYVGRIHGFLFVLYVIYSFLIKKQMNWNTKDFIIVNLLSFVPFGTFYMERKFLAN